MSTSKPLGLGVIGCGNVLSVYRPLIDRLRARDDVEVVMACGRESQRETALASLGLERLTTADQEVIDCPEVDGVLILTSMPEHARLARAALEAGKHVLLEKPLAITLDDGRGLVELAKRSPGHLVCAPFTTLSPTFQTLARRIQNRDNEPTHPPHKPRRERCRDRTAGSVADGSEHTHGDGRCRELAFGAVSAYR